MPSLLERLRNRNLPAASPADRRRFIMDRAAGKRVLHLGCIDWPYLERKIAEGSLLHADLAQVASEVVGFDSDAEGAAVFERNGWPVIVGDLERMPELPEFDVVIAGEVIEHLSNPGLFLASLAHRCPRTEVVVTTPSAYAAKRYWRFLLGHEQVHPDHVAYYSPLTLRAILGREGYSILEERPYPIGDEYTTLPNYYRWFERAGVLVQPWTADGLIAVAVTPTRDYQASGRFRRASGAAISSAALERSEPE